jgi:glutathione S-transferase
MVWRKSHAVVVSPRSNHQETDHVEKITLFGFAPSTYTRTARMAAYEKGVAAELLPVAYGQPGHFELHPFGKMPIMRHGNVTLYETLAIVSYIDDVFNGPLLIPHKARERAETFAAISVALDYAYRPVVHTEPEGDGFAAADLARANTVLDWLERRIGDRGHVAGSTLTAADLFFAPMVYYHRGKVGDDMTIGKRPRLGAWLDRMAARPSFILAAAA